MNDEIQVTNRDLLVACYAAITGLFDEAGIAWNGASSSGGKWLISVGAAQNDLLGYESWDFSQSRTDPHMQQALVNARSFVSNEFADEKALKEKFDATYADMKEIYGVHFERFIELLKERFDSENYETSSWYSSTDDCF